MLKFRWGSGFVAAALGAIMPVAQASAEEGSALPGDFSANVGIFTDYNFRGFTQTDKNPAIQGGFDWSHETGVYAGVWASNVDFNDGSQASIEMDAYGGFAGEVNGVGYDIGFIYYAYPGAASALDYNFWEVAFALSTDVGPASVSAGVNYSPNNFGDTGDAVYYQIGFSVPIVENLSFDANGNYYDVKPAFSADYFYWNAGLTYSFEWFDADLRYHDTDLKGCTGLCDAEVIFGISRSF